MSTRTLEQVKYEKMWRTKRYRTNSPGEFAVKDFLKHNPKGDTLVDIGCGTGRAGQKLNKKFKVTLYDIANNAAEVPLPFVHGCLWEDPLPKSDWGFCCDVMEHIPEEHVDPSLKNIARHCKNVYFRIFFREDRCGEEFDEVLHLTVKPFEWWNEKLSQYFDILYSRGDELIGVWIVKR